MTRIAPILLLCLVCKARDDPWRAVSAPNEYAGATVIGGVVHAAATGAHRIALHSARPNVEPGVGTRLSLRGEKIGDVDLRRLSLLLYGSGAYARANVSVTLEDGTLLYYSHEQQVGKSFDNSYKLFRSDHPGFLMAGFRTSKKLGFYKVVNEADYEGGQPYLHFRCVKSWATSDKLYNDC